MSKNQVLKVLAAVSGLVAGAQAQAASVIDAATKTAITTGFTDLKDTLLDVTAVSYPWIIGATVILMAPAIVKGLLHLAGRK